MPGDLDVSLLFNKPAVVVSSVRYLGSVHFKAEAFTDSDEEAKQVSERLSSFLTIFRTAEVTVGTPGPDIDLKQFFESLKVDQHGDRAELTAIVPTNLIRKMVAESPSQFTPEKPEAMSPKVHK